VENEKKGIKCSYAVLVIILFAALAFVTDYAFIQNKINKCSCPDCSLSGNTNTGIVEGDTTDVEIKNDNSNITFLTDTEVKFDCEEYTLKVVDGDIIINAYDKELNITGYNAKYVYTNGIMECGNYNLYFLTEQGYLFKIIFDHPKNIAGEGYYLSLVSTNIKGIINASNYEKINEKNTAYYMNAMTLDGNYQKIYWATM
jgi:hypothetical protein